MHVFIDDSTSFRSEGFQCFAGFMAPPERYDVLSQDWKALLDHRSMKFLHTSDFLSGKGDHRDTQFSYDERVAIIGEFIEVIRKTMQFCICVGVEKADYHAYSPKQRGGLGTAGFCLQRIAHICHKHFDKIESPTPLNFVFDDSEKDSPKIYHAWATMKKRHGFDKGLVSSITFAEDHVFWPMQAADLLACGFVQEHGRGEDRWKPGSPFAPLFREAPEPPLGMVVDTEYWNAATLAGHGIFGGVPERGGSTVA